MTLEVFVRKDPYVRRHDRKMNELRVERRIVLSVDPDSKHHASLYRGTRKQWSASGRADKRNLKRTDLVDSRNILLRCSHTVNFDRTSFGQCFSNREPLSPSHS